MEKAKKSLKIMFLIIIMMFALTTQVFAEEIKPLDTWWLADSGKHLDWGGSTKYQTQFDKAVQVWNGCISGVIRKDSIKTIEDLTLSDYYSKSVSPKTNTITVAYTHPDGYMKFNKYMMDQDTATQRLNVCIHELGHALGLGHNKKGTVMYYKVTTKVSLSEDDKANYKKSYKRF